MGQSSPHSISRARDRNFVSLALSASQPNSTQLVQSPSTYVDLTWGGLILDHGGRTRQDLQRGFHELQDEFGYFGPEYISVSWIAAGRTHLLKPLNPCRAESTPPPTTSISRFVFLPTKINTTQDPMRDGRDRERERVRCLHLYSLWPASRSLRHYATMIQILPIVFWGICNKNNRPRTNRNGEN